MNTIGTMFGYLYGHTERERFRFKINTYGFSIDTSKGLDYPMIFFEKNMFIRKVKGAVLCGGIFWLYMYTIMIILLRLQIEINFNM